MRLHFKQWVLCIVHGTHKYGIWQNNFKTGSHGTIHTFKNYFTTVFLVFSNKRYPNSPQKLSFFFFIFFPFSLYFMRKIKRNPMDIGLGNICIENILRHFLWKKKQVTDFFFTAFYIPYKSGIKTQNTTTLSWHDGHSISISAYRVFGPGGKDWDSSPQERDSHKYTFLKLSINKCLKGTR